MNALRSWLLPAALVGLTTVLTLQHADASVGSFALGRAVVQESNSGWRVMVSITLPKPPTSSRPTFKFTFTPQTVFDKTRESPKPVKNPKPIVETMQVEFGDASGKVWPQARAEMSIARQDGYLAGEYKLSAKGPNGDVGQPVTITLDGENR